MPDDEELSSIDDRHALHALADEQQGEITDLAIMVSELQENARHPVPLAVEEPPHRDQVVPPSDHRHPAQNARPA
jgi:hypothetical protein